IGVLGVHDDVRRRVCAGFGADGATIIVLGETRDELGGSAWAHVAHGHLGGIPPAVDLAAEQRLAGLIAVAAAAGLLASAHDLSDGGLAIALAESCLRGGNGCSIDLDDVSPQAFTALFSESAGRAVVTVRPEQAAEFAALAHSHGVPAAAIGTVTGDSLQVNGQFDIPLDELAAVWQGTLPALFG